MVHVERITLIVKLMFKNSIQRSSLCYYSDAHRLVKGNIIVKNTGTAAALNSRGKKLIFKNCAQFTDWISKIKNTEIHHGKDIGIVIPMYNLTEYSDIIAMNQLWMMRAVMLISLMMNDLSFEYREKIIGPAGNNKRKDVQIMAPLKYISIFWGTFEMPLINCWINIF